MKKFLDTFGPGMMVMVVVSAAWWLWIMPIHSRMDELDAERAALNVRLAATQDLMGDVLAHMERTSSNVTELVQEADRQWRARTEQVNAVLRALADERQTVTQRVFVATTPSIQPRPIAGKMLAGVPAEQYREIVAEAVKEWPGNFVMQQYEIKRQTEAWRKLHQ